MKMCVVFVDINLGRIIVRHAVFEGGADLPLLEIRLPNRRIAPGKQRRPLFYFPPALGMVSGS